MFMLAGNRFSHDLRMAGTLFGDKICHARTFPAVFRAYWVIAVPWKYR